MTGTDISVIVATYNRAPFLRRALESLVRQENGGRFVFEVVVVDNASTDGTRAVVENIARETTVPVKYAYEGNAGISFARNRGIAESDSDWIAFFDDDQVAYDGWLEELLAVAEKAGAKCVGGKIVLSTQGTTRPPGSPVCRSILGETFHGKAPGPLPPKSLPGTGNVLIARSLFETVGAFDESFTRGCEDADLFRRVRRAGFPIWYAPGAVVAHIVPPHRMEHGYLLLSARRQGANYAFLDRKEGGRRKVGACCAGRIGQALLVNAPAYLHARIRGDADAALGSECLLSKSAGYLRASLMMMLPRIFTGEAFLSGMDYRKESGLTGSGPREDRA